jgi:methionyl-tRNA synthetase
VTNNLQDPKKILVTAALPYANGAIHLGHLAGAYLPADIYARYQRLKNRDVLFLCGSDEHGVPITLTADREGISPQAVVDRYHEQNRLAFERFGMSFDVYSRTSMSLHHETAREFLLDFHRRGILKEKSEKQFFDRKAGRFLPDRYVEGTCPNCGSPEARGDQCENCGSDLNPSDLLNPKSKITGEIPELRETSHLYFPLGDFQKRLEQYVREMDQKDGWKQTVLSYCRGWFQRGLQERAVTRDMDWGVKIPLPGYQSKVIYVWFDAVLGYISAARDWSARKKNPDLWKRYWLDESTKYVAFIGKDNVVFHCIMFPAMLMAWNDGNASKYVLPSNVPANEFLNLQAQKFSKSRGWGVDVQDVLAVHPPDALRYYVATALPEYRDSDFTWKDFQAKTNNELADIFGNFINRTLAFAARTFQGKVPGCGTLNDRDRGILEILRKTPGAAGNHYEHYRFRDGLAEVMNLARAANKYFTDSEPWVTARGDRDRCATTINISLQIAKSLAVLMAPVTPFSCRKIFSMLNIENGLSPGAWDSSAELSLASGHQLGQTEILFTKLEDAVIEKELQELGVPKEVEPGVGPVSATSGPTLISLNEFRAVDLRVAKVLECTRVQKSEKLLRLKVSVGSETRQIVAGVAKHYPPEAMVGKSVVIVYNLKPAKLMGEESQGMLLAASDGDGKLVIVVPESDIVSGSVVK